MPPVWPVLLAASLLTAPTAEVPGLPPGLPEGYEDALVRWGLAREGRSVEPEPEGKPLESVEVASEDVVAPSDPYPALLNVFHARTREQVIQREVLLTLGAPYVSALALETARNLRRLGIFAVVRVVPVRGRTPGTVSLLVITKDLWSLRLNQDIQLVGALVQSLHLQGTEQNFLGLNKKVALDFLLRRDSVSVGQSYVDPRLVGSRWSLSESAALVFSRAGSLEGSRGGVVLARPLFSLSTPWSVQTQMAWRVQPVRVFRGADIWQVPYPGGGTVPYVYNAREWSGSAVYLRSWGTRFKLDAGGGVGAYSRRYGAPADSDLDEERRAWLRDTLLPRSEDATYVLGYARVWEPRYEVMRDVDTYALSEDFQVGPYLTATARHAPALLGAGAARAFTDVGLTARYRVRLGDALTTVASAASVRRWLDGGGWTDRRWAVEASQVSPKVLGGRFVARALLDVDRDDLNERVLLLGGGNGLRGAAPEAYSGQRMVLLNLEYRTRPLVVSTVHLGGVLFYDAGSAFDVNPSVVHSVGVGVRLLFPQFNTYPFRLDFGYVLNADRPPVGGRFSFSGGQVTEFRPTFLDAPL